jgi:hypothetical protein
MTRRNLTSPLYFLLPVYMLVEHPPPEYAQTLDWVRDHNVTRQHHQSLTCTAVDTHGRYCRIGVLACSQHRDTDQYTDMSHFVYSGAALAALCFQEQCCHAPSLLRRSLCRESQDCRD